MIEQLVSTTFHLFKDLGIWGSFLSMVIENIGIPLPTEAGYLIAQDLISRSVFSYPFVLFVLTAGHLTGAVISFWIGRIGGKAVEKRFEKNNKLAEVQDKLKKWYQKYGNFTVFLTRFVGYVRPWSSFVAGFAEIEFWPFLLWTALGSLIFNVMTLYFSSIFILIWRRYSTFHILFIVISTVLFFGFIIYEIINFFWTKGKGKNK